jgi:hypothetical protein
MPQFHEDVLQRLEGKFSTSTDEVVQEVGVDRCLVLRVVREYQLRPLHRQKVQRVGPKLTIFEIKF